MACCSLKEGRSVMSIIILTLMVVIGIATLALLIKIVF
jgi:hypothetical protein